MRKSILKLWVPIIIIIGLFIFASYIGQEYSGSIIEIMQGNEYLGAFLYISLSIIAVVLAPISAAPLIPIAASLWGAATAAIYSIIGWAIGSMIAFYLARRYGYPLVSKFTSIKKLNEIEKRIPSKNIFWTIVFLRISVPVDILSYALGLFSKISYIKYFLATLIGITPFAFIFAYAGIMDPIYQIAALIAAVVVLLLGMKYKSC